jgi:hypothetical protein
MLGITMPLSSARVFVARHVCRDFVSGPSSQGDDSTILNRGSTHRIDRAVVPLAVVPAAAFEDLGPVLAITERSVGHVWRILDRVV